MSLSLTVIAPEGCPDANEPIVSMGWSDYGLRGVCKALFGYSLEKIHPESLSLRMLDVVNELDKGDLGLFKDDYFWPYFKHSSEEDKTFYDLIAHRTKTTVKSYFGDSNRRLLRQDAFRFYLYAKAGYKLEWSE